MLDSPCWATDRFWAWSVQFKLASAFCSPEKSCLASTRKNLQPVLLIYTNIQHMGKTPSFCAHCAGSTATGHLQALLWPSSSPSMSLPLQHLIHPTQNVCPPVTTCLRAQSPSAVMPNSSAAPCLPLCKTALTAKVGQSLAAFCRPLIRELSEPCGKLHSKP